MQLQVKEGSDLENLKEAVTEPEEQKCFLTSKIVGQIRSFDLSGHWISLTVELVGGFYDLFYSETIIFLELTWDNLGRKGW